MSKYFLYIGNAYPHKNLDRLIRAIVLMNKDVKEIIRLKIGGSRSVFTERLKNSVNKYSAQKYVDILGFVPDQKLPSLYRNSTAYVFPSLAEGFGLPGLEAMEAGTIVLASNIPVFREVYRNSVEYFDPYDPRSIALSMENALRLGKKERNIRIEKAKKFAKRYSWSKMAQETLNIYLSLK